MILSILSFAHASGGTLPPQMQTGTVNTVVGPIPKSYAWGLCYSPNVYVGTVVGHSTYRKTLKDGKGRVKAKLVYSSIELAIERVGRGPGHKTVTLDVPGGPWKGMWIKTQPNAPQPVDGERYLFAYHEFGGFGPGEFSNWPIGQPIVSTAFTLDKKMPLPSNADLATELEKMCDTAKFIY